MAETRPASITRPPVTAPIPSGKTVSFVHCGVAVCDTIAAAIKNAASILGWKVDVVASDGTPASVQAAWASVVRLHPDVAFGSGFDRALFASEASQLASMKVPVWTGLHWTARGRALPWPSSARARCPWWVSRWPPGSWPALG